MAAEKLVLSDLNGQVLRTFNWNQVDGVVVRRFDTKRIEVLPSTEKLVSKKIQFEEIAKINRTGLSSKSLFIGELGELKFVEAIATVHKDAVATKEKDRRFYKTLGLVFLLVSCFLTYIFNRQPEPEKIETVLKQELVKIIKSQPIKKPTAVSNINSEKMPETKVTKDISKSIKRLGALAALGSLTKSNQKSGLNLGAVNTTAGPGLGGTAGSGGVQTSLYGKGILAAPLGVGGNIQGAGGYGTKGKGGGQAGYGQLSLVGASGASSVPLTNEASVESGLDRDAIAAVINKNIGQIRFCYEQGLLGNSGLNGRVAVDFVIGGNGIVKSASVASSSLGSASVEECVTMRLKSWKFPLPSGGVDVKVSYPFVLRRAGQG